MSVRVYMHVCVGDWRVVVKVVDRFYTALFSALVQTHSALVACGFEWTISSNRREEQTDMADQVYTFYIMPFEP